LYSYVPNFYTRASLPRDAGISKSEASTRYAESLTCAESGRRRFREYSLFRVVISLLPIAYGAVGCQVGALCRRAWRRGLFSEQGFCLEEYASIKPAQRK